MPPRSERLNTAIQSLPSRLAVGGTTDYTPFVIIGSNRTGTNYLLHLLRSTNQVVGFAELFSRVGPFWANRTNSPLNHRAAKRLRERDAQAFLERCVYRRHPASTAAVGFKAHYGQLEQYPTARRWLEEREGLVVLHIRRKNLIAMEASKARAQATGLRLKSVHDHTTDRTQVHLDPVRLLASFERYLSNADWPSRVLPQAHVVEINYESLADEPRPELSQALDALCVSHGVGVEARTGKQNQLGWRAVVSNPGEITDAVANSTWHHLLDLPG